VAPNSEYATPTSIVCVPGVNNVITGSVVSTTSTVLVTWVAEFEDKSSTLYVTLYTPTVPGTTPLASITISEVRTSVWPPIISDAVAFNSEYPAPTSIVCVPGVFNVIVGGVTSPNLISTVCAECSLLSTLLKSL